MKILIPIDFSKLSDKAIDFALNIANNKKNVSLTLYYAFIPIETGFISRQTLNIENRLTREKLNIKMISIVNRVKNRYKNINVNHFVDEGIEYKSIVKFSKTKKIDLIIMGSKGASGLKEKLFGSITSTVIGETTVPVICIPESYKESGIKKILYATDYRDGENNALKQLKNLCELLKAKLFVVHFSYEGLEDSVENYYLKQFQKSADKILKYDVSGYIRLKGDDFLPELNKYIMKNKIDMLAMVTYKRKGLFNRLFDKSLTKKIACHTKIPLMALHS